MVDMYNERRVTQSKCESCIYSEVQRGKKDMVEQTEGFHWNALAPL